jgi:type IV pilus assembly protein PilC
MIYRYEAYSNKEGKAVKGTIEGASEELAEGILYRAGYDRIISLKGSNAGIDWQKLVVGSPKVSQQALLDFTTELSIMIEAGLSLQNALGQLEKQSSERSMKNILNKLAADLRAGTPLHKALSAHPHVFSQTYISMIEANEKSGTLDDGLQQIAKGLKQDVETKGKIQQALVQPAIVVALAIGVIFIMIGFVLPKLTGVFTQFGAKLPATTRLLMSFSSFVAVNKYYILLAIAVLIFMAIVLIRRPAGRRYLDTLILKLPLIGQVVVWENTARFSRTAANLLKAGVLLPDAMNIIERSMSNVHIRESLTAVRTKLIQGQTFSSAVNADPLFPKFLTEMIAVGESSGALESSLGTVADYYEAKTTRRITRLTGLIEPILIVVLAAGVGFIAITLISTIYGLMNYIK